MIGMTKMKSHEKKKRSEVLLLEFYQLKPGSREKDNAWKEDAETYQLLL